MSKPSTERGDASLNSRRPSRKGSGMIYVVKYRSVGTEEMDWTTIASFEKRTDRDRYLANLLDNSEKYRVRNRSGKVIRGPLYAPFDALPDLPCFRPRYEPTPDQILLMAEVFRDTNVLERMDIGRKWWEKWGRSHDPVPVLVNENSYLRDDHWMCDQDPWWVQIGEE